MEHKIGRPKTKHLLAVGRPTVHGVSSPKSILTMLSQKERRLYKFIYELEPHLTQTDSILAQQLVRNLIKLQMFDEYFEKSGVFDDEGKLRDPYRVYFTCQKNVMRLCDMLALSTESKMKMGITWGELRDKQKPLLADEED